MSGRRVVVPPLAKHFPRALAVLTEVMVKGAETHDSPWEEMSKREITEHMSEHAFNAKYPSPLDTEDHLAHMICRALMLLEKREKENG